MTILVLGGTRMRQFRRRVAADHLQCGVEAARAGEAGRGSAVLASEVQRSAETDSSMDQITQQNAAMVEETTAAAGALVQETEGVDRPQGGNPIPSTGTPS